MSHYPPDATEGETLDIWQGATWTECEQQHKDEYQRWRVLEWSQHIGLQGAENYPDTPKPTGLHEAKQSHSNTNASCSWNLPWTQQRASLLGPTLRRPVSEQMSDKTRPGKGIKFEDRRLPFPIFCTPACVYTFVWKCLWYLKEIWPWKSHERLWKQTEVLWIIRTGEIWSFLFKCVE